MPDADLLACRRAWSELLPGFDATFDETLPELLSPSRAYHSFAHVADCLRSHLLEHAADRRAVALALVFHDCVYEPGSPTNEELSARRFRDVAARAALASDLVERVAAWILATASHDGDGLHDDGRIVLDVDMSILAAPWERYAQYVRGVRREFAFVPDEAWREGRSRFLESLRARESIFLTEPGRELWELRARANVARELAEA